MLATGDLVRPDERIHQESGAGRPDSCGDVSRLAVKSKVAGRTQDRALEYNDTETRAGAHPREQILEPFEYGGVYNVKGGFSNRTLQYADVSSLPHVRR